MIPIKKYIFIFLVLLIHPGLLFGKQEITKDIHLIPVEVNKKEKNPARNVACWELGCGLILIGQETYMTYLTLAQARESGWFNFLSGDPVRACNVKIGKNIIIVDFKRNLVLKDLILQSFSMEGSITIHSSDKLNTPSHKSWKPVGTKTIINPNTPTEIPLGLLDTRYLMITLDCTKEGQISSLSCMSSVQIKKRGQKTPEDLTKSTQDKDKLIPFNYARPYEGAKVDYVTGGEVKNANQILNENFSEPYSFPKEDKTAAMVIDLSDTQTVNELSILFDSQPGKFKFIFMDEIPQGIEKQKTSYLFPSKYILFAANEGSLVEMVTLGKIRENSQKELTLLSELPDDARVIEETVDSTTKKLQINFKEINSRYVVVYWEADPNELTENDNGLQIYQINITGNVDPSLILPDEVIPLYDTNPNNSLTTDTPIDNTSTPIVTNLNPPVEPPTLPTISP